MMGMREIRVEMHRIRVRIKGTQGIRVGMMGIQGIRAGMVGIRVGMQEIGV